MHLKFFVYLVLFIAFSSARADAFVEYFRAIQVDDVGTVQALLGRGFDPNATNDKGQSGLHLALREGAPRVAAALLAQPQIRFDAVNASGETPVMMAALRGQTEWVLRLLDRGAQLNRSGWTPLHYAAISPEPALVAVLLDRGAEIEAGSPNRTTPLMMAARYGDERAVDLLLARGANPRAKNDQGLTAADFARLGGREALTNRLAALAR